MGANDDEQRRQGGAPNTPNPNRTMFGVATTTPPSGTPAIPANVPAATPTPPAAINKTTFGVPSPVRPTPRPMPVAVPRPTNAMPAATPQPAPAYSTPQPPPATDPRGFLHTQAEVPQTFGGSHAQPPQQHPHSTVSPSTTPALAPQAHGYLTPQQQIQQTSFGTGPMTAQNGPAPTPQPPSSHGNRTTNTGLPRHEDDPQPPSDVVASGMGLEPGGRIHQYELIRELGRGGMGMVWAARDTKLGRRVAIKFLLDASRAVAERFLTEARATAQCSHDNIVIIHEVDELGGMPYMVLEFLEGNTLRGAMGSYQSGAKMPASRVVELALPVARALARAHELGIVHRDLKPENVFVTNAGQVKVLDFGIAKAVATREAAPRRTQYGDIASMGNMNLTREGALVGTLPYMSPEQMGIGEVDHRSDIWALGIMMYEMLAGRHPIDPLTSEALITNAISEDPMPSIRDACPELPDALVMIVDGCLRKRIVERFPRATDIAKRLEDLLPGRAGRQLADGESPYPGLTAFQETDADRFFGRSRDITRMVAKVREYPITGIVGPSGVGKSSFIRAGVGPALKVSGEHWDVVTLRPGRQPLAALASIVQRLTTHSGLDMNAQVADHHQLMHRLRTEPGFIGTLLRARARSTNSQILLFVDQFEELYTLVPDPEERKAFTAALTGVADDTAAPLRVVVSMRSDFLDRIAEDPRFMEEMSRGLVFLQPPDRNGLREALVAPIEMVSHRFESAAMVEDMLDALVGTPGALPLLQFAAAKLWDARDRQQRLLTVASYNAIGGISGALATHADDVVAQMNERTQKVTQKIMRRLVTPERTRAIVELADLYTLSQDTAEVGRAIDALVGARLLVVQTRGDSGGGSVEIVHESLIERWPTLRRWLDEDQEDAAFLSQLAAAAKQWDAKGRASGLLWTGDAMEEARRWYHLRPRELPAREQAFLAAVFSLAKRGKRVKRVLLVVSFTVLGAVAAGASVALVKIRGAEQEATAALADAKKEKALADVARDAAEKEKQVAQKALADKNAAEAAKNQVSAEKDAEEKAKLAALAKAEQERLEKEKAEAEKTEVQQQSAEALAAQLKVVQKEKAKADEANKALKARENELEALNKKLEAENKRLQDEKSKLTTKLKGM